jgi:hypothetical protein
MSVLPFEEVVSWSRAIMADSVAIRERSVETRRSAMAAVARSRELRGRLRQERAAAAGANGAVRVLLSAP